MFGIPFKANKLGAESLNSQHISYGKDRVSGSLQISYMLHSKSWGMPGQKSLFCITSTSKPRPNFPLKINQIMQAFSREKVVQQKIPIGLKYSKDSIFNFNYKKFHPYDDQSLKICINAAYNHVFGNYKLMEAERSIEAERRLRNGDLNVREFIRHIVQSSFYKEVYYQKLSQLKYINLIFKHVLGRPPLSQNEIIKNIEVIHQEGINHQIDCLIDSLEYEENFGDHIVPFMRSWDSSCGLYTSSFMKTIKSRKYFASSDNLIKY